MNDVRLLDLGGLAELGKADSSSQPVDGRKARRTRPERPEPALAKPPLLPPPGCFLVSILTMMPSIMLEETGGVPDVETLRHVRLMKQLGLGMGLVLEEVLNRIGYTWNCFLGELPEMTAAEAEMHLSLLLNRDVFRHDPVTWARLKPKQQERTTKWKRQFVRRLLGHLRVGLRWEYWLSVRERGQMPAGPIPRLDFSDARQGAEVIGMWRRTAEVFERAGFTGARAMEMMVEMILYGFLERAELPGGVGEEAWAKAFQIFDLGLALSCPTDALEAILPSSIRGFGPVVWSPAAASGLWSRAFLPSAPGSSPLHLEISQPAPAAPPDEIKPFAPGLAIDTSTGEIIPSNHLARSEEERSEAAANYMQLWVEQRTHTPAHVARIETSMENATFWANIENRGRANYTKRGRTTKFTLTHRR